MALILARAVAPASKLATISWWADTTLGADLDVCSVSTDEVYAAMDWLLGRQERHREEVGGPASGPDGESVADRDV